jgi:hypothetical protein
MRSNQQLLVRLAAVALGAALALAPVTAAAGEPTADLSPPAITLGEAALLRVLADGEAPPALPSVRGLRFHRAGQSTEMTSIDGDLAQQTWFLYHVVASRPGAYAIPIGGQMLRLTVAPAGADAPYAGAVPPAESSPRENHQAPQGSLALLRVTLPGQKLYVGQTAPITIKAYFRAGTQVMLTGAPDLGVAAFTVSQLPEQPRQSVESIRGVPYRVATWTGQMSAAMPGRYPTTATLPMVVRSREAERRPAADPFAGMLEDDDASSSASLLHSFMSQSGFGGFGDVFGRVRERTMTVRAPTQAVEVLPLPDAGQPPGFSGAIGHFAVRATLAPAAGAAFEPMKLAIEISGQGSFDRVATTGLPASPDWKTYPPSARLAPGLKVFEQAVVPQRAGRVELPAVPFSYFDPDLRRYVTRSTTPIAVQVAPAPAGSTTAAVVAGAHTSAAAGGPPTGWRPNRLDEGRYAATLRPPHRRPWFWAALPLPWLALAGGLALARGRGRAASTRARRRAVRTTIAQQRQAMRTAAVARDPVRFFDAARTALQHQLGARWSLAPDAVTAAEAERRLGEAGTPIVAALRAAEHLSYGGASSDPGALAEVAATIERQLSQPENQP